MKEYKLLIPIKDNSGLYFGEKKFIKFETLLLNTFLGYTKGSIVKGAWKNDKGVIFHDDSIVYYIACNDVKMIEKVLSSNPFLQESYFISCISENVDFYTPIKSKSSYIDNAGELLNYD